MKRFHTFTANYLWWGALLLIIGGGMFIQLYYQYEKQELIIDFDEVNLYIFGYQQINGLEVNEKGLIGYPPGLFWLERLTYCTLVSPGCAGDAPQTNAVVRYMTVFAGITNLVTAVMLALAVRAWGGAVPALLAAAIWLCLLPIIGKTVLALTEAWQALGYVLAAYGTIMVMKSKHPAYAIIATLGGLLAVIFKYSAFPTLGPGIVAVLWLIWREKTQRRQWGITLGLQMLLIVSCALGLLYIYGARDFFNNPNEVATFLNPQGNPYVSLESSESGVIALLNAHARQVGLTPFLLWAVLGIASIWYVWRGQTQERLVWILLVGMLVFHLGLILTYIRFWNGVLRYTTPVSGVTILLVALGASSLGQAVDTRWRRLGSAAIVAALVVWLLPNAISGFREAAIERPKPNTQWAYVRWTETSLPTDAALLIYFQDWIFFTTDYGDYALPNRVWVQGIITEQPIADWLAKGVRYATLLPNEERAMTATPEKQAEFEQMLRLKRLPPANTTETWRGEPMSVYRLTKYQQEATAIFGEQIRFLGYDLSATEVQAGASVQFTPFWQAQQTPNADLNVYVHLVAVDDRTQLYTQADGMPALPLRPTSTWNDPDEVLVGNTFTLTLPPDLPAGDYRLIMGLYDWRSGARWLTQENSDFVEIAILTVKP